MPDWLNILLTIMGALGFLLALTGIVYKAGKLSQRVSNNKEDIGVLYKKHAGHEKETKRDLEKIRKVIVEKHQRLRNTLTDHGQMLAVLVATCPNCPVERIKEIVDRNSVGEAPDPLDDNPTFRPGGRGELAQSDRGRTEEPE